MKHKKRIIIITTAVVVVAAVVGATLFFTWQINNKPGKVDAALAEGHDPGVFGADVLIHDSTQGEIIIGASLERNDPPVVTTLQTIDDPDRIWDGDPYSGNHTPVEKARMKDGSIGVLTIPAIKLSANVYEGNADNLAAMSMGIAHFPSTSAWDGLVGFSAHNINLDGSDGYFKLLYTLKENDRISYTTALGERSYVVSSITTIDASDWSPLHYTDSNQLTMITCISDQPNKRLCVRAVEVE